MPPPRHALDAFAEQYGLDDAYRQKLSGLYGYEQPPPMPPPMDPYAPQDGPMLAVNSPPPGADKLDVGFDMSALSSGPLPSHEAVAAPRQDLSFLDKRVQEQQPLTFSDKSTAALLSNVPPPAPAGQMPQQKLSADDAALAEARAMQGAVPGQPGIEVVRARPAGRSGPSSAMMGMLGKANAASRAAHAGLDDAARKAADAQANTLTPGAAANANLGSLEDDVAAMKQYEAAHQAQIEEMAKPKLVEAQANVEKAQKQLVGMDDMDPKRAWKQADFGGKLGIALTYMLAGFAEGAGVKGILSSVENNIFGKDLEQQKLAYEQQKGRIGTAQNQYGQLMQSLGDEKAARTAYMLPKYEALAAKMRGEIAKGKAGEGIAGQNAIMTELEAKIAQGKAITADAMAQNAYKLASSQAGPSPSQADAILRNPTAQKELKEQMVSTAVGDFALAGGTTPEAVAIRDTLNNTKSMVTGIDQAIALAKNTSAAGNKGWTSQEFKLLEGKLKHLLVKYGKQNKLGTMDEGTERIGTAIIGNPSRSVDDTVAQLKDMRASAIQDTNNLVAGHQLQHVTPVNYVDKNGAVIAALRPGGWVNKPRTSLSAPISVK